MPCLGPDFHFNGGISLGSFSFNRNYDVTIPILSLSFQHSFWSFKWTSTSFLYKNKHQNLSNKSIRISIQIQRKQSHNRWFIELHKIDNPYNGARVKIETLTFFFQNGKKSVIMATLLARNAYNKKEERCVTWFHVVFDSNFANERVEISRRNSQLWDF